MAIINNSSGYTIPTSPEKSQGKISHGFATPCQDRIPQILCIPPKRVLPIVFIPGIMGSNLRMSGERQRQLGQKNNISWRPDNSYVTVAQMDDTPLERQLRLDPDVTEVDSYDPENNSTGDLGESSDERNGTVRYSNGYFGYKRLDGPLLQGDPPRTKNGRTQDQKARERGWGEVFFGSYQHVLTMCEQKLNAAINNGVLNAYLENHVVGVDPSEWNAHPAHPIKEIDKKTISDAVQGCWFPVHAMGYNWLKGNGVSGVIIAKRIENLIKSYNDKGFQCEKVILVTHSMGGLVARAVIHPEIGDISEKILGVVHGVMPAMGAGAAYKRMRCGVESSGVLGNISAGVLGDNAADVTAVLASAQGALELLPNRAYGKHWLQLKRKKKVIKSWPENCPYEEIYKIRGKWFGLFREDLINPGRFDRRDFSNTITLLDRAKIFHEKIGDTYHDESYAHYGVDSDKKAWHKVVWEADENFEINEVDSLILIEDNKKGDLELIQPAILKLEGPSASVDVKMLDAAEPGDETVPSHSADAQLLSKKFKAIFRQTGYEHQERYSDSSAIASTMYSLIKIISNMKWSKL